MPKKNLSDTWYATQRKESCEPGFLAEGVVSSRSAHGDEYYK